MSKKGEVYLAAESTFNDAKWKPTMDEEVGKKMALKFNYEDYYDFGCNGGCDDDGNSSIEAFKINVSNIQYVAEMAYGHQTISVTTALVDKMAI